MQIGPSPITDAAGARALALSSPQDPSAVLVILQNGERLTVPAALVRLQADGTYLFERSFQDALAAVSGGEVVLPLVAEQLKVDVRQVTRERLRVRTTVTTREETVDVPLTEEQVAVERVPLGQVVEAPAPPREEGDTLIIPIYEEVLVVEKRLVLKEELRIKRTRQERQHQEQVTLRREEASVERISAEAETV